MRKYCTVKGKHKFIALSKVGGGDIAFRAFIRSSVLVDLDYARRSISRQLQIIE